MTFKLERYQQSTEPQEKSISANQLENTGYLISLNLLFYYLSISNSHYMCFKSYFHQKECPSFIVISLINKKNES